MKIIHFTDGELFKYTPRGSGTAEVECLRYFQLDFFAHQSSYVYHIFMRNFDAIDEIKRRLPLECLGIT